MRRKLEFQGMSKTCHVPIRGKITVDRKTGEIVSEEYEYADIPAEALAQFFIERFGIDAKPREYDVPEGSLFAVGYRTKYEDGSPCALVLLKPRFKHECSAYSYYRDITAKIDKSSAHQYSIFLLRPGESWEAVLPL